MMNLKKCKFVFLILHYQSIDETIESIKSIEEKYKSYNISILIVDNASPNKTGVKLKEMYKNNSNIYVILNSNNLGFSRGNNIGFKFAKENLNPDFIIMINSDVYMIQNEFLDLVCEEYNKSNFAVLGPKINLPNGKINYHRATLRSKKEIRKRILELKKRYLKNLIFLHNFNINTNKKKDIIKKLERKENAVLNGCCMIFSKQYIDKFDGLEEKTFMYGEEELLNILLKREKLLSVYNPKLEVFHHEYSSTKKISNSSRKVNLFRLKYMIIANKIILKELEHCE